MQQFLNFRYIRTALFQTIVAFLIVRLSTVPNVVEAAGPVIGTAVAKGSFRVDNATVIGNATLEEGATVETGSTVSSLELTNGTRLTLGLTSRGRVYGDHMVLERGESRLERGSDYHVEALGLTIKPETGNTSGRLSLVGAARVRVAALTGSFRVLNSRGMLVANIGIGSALDFEPQASSTSGLAKVTGVVQRKNGHLTLTDETTNVTVEITGPGVEREVGNRVEVIGSTDSSFTPVPEASEYIRVTQVRRIGKGPAVASGAAAPAGAAPTAGSAGGIANVSTGTLVIIGGVAVAATVGGLAAAHELPGQSGTTPQMSR